MKGKLVKTDKGWFVRYRETTPLSITTEILPLHPDSGIPQDAMCDVLDYDFAEVDFDWCVVVDHNTGKGKEYAKLITLSRKHSITDYGVEGIDSCLEYKENDVEKLAEKYYGPGDYGLESKQGFIKGYNKAKETLYTEEQVRKAYFKGAADVHDKCTDRTWRGVETKVDIELLKKLNAEYIQSLKQPKQ